VPPEFLDPNDENMGTETYNFRYVKQYAPVDFVP
jgi:hypothetical protein